MLKTGLSSVSLPGTVVLYVVLLSNYVHAMLFALQMQTVSYAQKYITVLWKIWP